MNEITPLGQNLPENGITIYEGENCVLITKIPLSECISIVGIVDKIVFHPVS